MARAAGILVDGSPRRVEYIDRSDRVFAFPVHVRHQECEYAIPRAHAAEALRGLRDIIAKRRWDIGFIVEMRFVAGEDIWLSPAQGRDTCYIGVMQYRRLPHEPYFRAFEDLVAPWQGRPHWGKIHYQDARTLMPLYPHWQSFQTIRTN
jgi:L-gulonolactone oxidase